jgi:hypothetical protein
VTKSIPVTEINGDRKCKEVSEPGGGGGEKEGLQRGMRK